MNFSFYSAGLVYGGLCGRIREGYENDSPARSAAGLLPRDPRGDRPPLALASYVQIRARVSYCSEIGRQAKGISNKMLEERELNLAYHLSHV